MSNRFGVVYTPDVLADWVATELLRRMPRKTPIVILDPACGEGALLRSIFRASRAPIKLVGVDIDAKAISKAASNLPLGTALRHADALQPQSSCGFQAGWKKLMRPSEISAVISNPPWGAELRQNPLALRAAGYELAQGQFDSYDLFLELCLKLVPERAVLAFIVPDSIFFPEHKPLRTLLLEKTQLHLLARLGEGFFGDVYRGTAIVICEKRKPKLSRLVECFRLRKELRDLVLENKLSLETAKTKEMHRVPQELFQTDPDKRFIIDVSREDLAYFQKIHACRSDWAEWLHSGRGVELSKTGAVILCPKCSTARPEPRDSKRLICESCGTAFRTNQGQRKQIIRKSMNVPRGWRRLIVGEDVDRYRCLYSRIIQADVVGINYKTPETFEGTKLLVRKTGVGLKAAIDDSGAFTNQVVFHYRPKPTKTPAFFLDYVLGVLCSRVMLAYHLKRTGENEWRSHPYVTQKTIAELPVPVVSDGQWQWRQAKAIADAVSKQRRRKHDDPEADLHIDSMVAGLYGLDKNGCAWVLGVLNEAQSLQSIATMRADLAQLRPVRV